MNTAGLDIDRIKRNVIEYWQAEAWNRPVKVISAQRGAQLGAAAGRLVLVRGYITPEKFVIGRQLHPNPGWRDLYRRSRSARTWREPVAVDR
jgi:hypothetical protein